MILVDPATYVWRGKVWCHMVATEGPDEPAIDAGADDNDGVCSASGPDCRICQVPNCADRRCEPSRSNTAPTGGAQ